MIRGPCLRLIQIGSLPRSHALTAYIPHDPVPDRSVTLIQAEREVRLIHIRVFDRKVKVIGISGGATFSIAPDGGHLICVP